MTRRRLSPEEAELWARVMASARPIDPVRPVLAVADPISVKPAPKLPAILPPAVTPTRRIAAPAKLPGTTLDRSWDRKLARGMVAPESTIDLHGHSLSSAHAILDAGIETALARGDRILLLITGKAPRPEAERPYARGAIRAAVGDWLAGSRHADRIAAVRGAHPRHGGTGALYIVLRRTRESG